MISADPSNEFHTSDSLAYGTFNAVKAQASVSGPLVRDRLSASVAFLRNRRDGTAYDPTLHRDVNRIDVDSARIKLRWTPDQQVGRAHDVQRHDRSQRQPQLHPRAPTGRWLLAVSDVVLGGAALPTFW